MSLNKKYTWHDFLKEFPEHKEKALKRTSAEGKKAFEAAYKKHIKGYLTKRAEIIEGDAKRAKTKLDDLVTKVKEQGKAGFKKRVKKTHDRIAKANAHLGRLAKEKNRNKTVQKNFK